MQVAVCVDDVSVSVSGVMQVVGGGASGQVAATSPTLFLVWGDTNHATTDISYSPHHGRGHPCQWGRGTLSRIRALGLSLATRQLPPPPTLLLAAGTRLLASHLLLPAFQLWMIGPRAAAGSGATISTVLGAECRPVSGVTSPAPLHQLSVLNISDASEEN